MAAERPQHPPHRDVIVIGGSAGSLDTIREIAQAIPADYSGTVFVVAHVGQSRSILPDLLRRVGSFTASHPREKEPIRKGHIYIAPPDRHMLIEDGQVCLSRGLAASTSGTVSADRRTSRAGISAAGAR